MRAESPPTKELRGSPARGNRAVVSKPARRSTESDDNTGRARDNHDVAEVANFAVDPVEQALAQSFGAMPLGRELPALCQNVLAAVLRFARDGVPDPTVPMLADVIGCCDRTVQRAVRACETMGWLAVEYRRVEPKFNLPNVYVVTPAGRKWCRPRGLRAAPRRPRNPSFRGRSPLPPGDTAVTALFHPSTPSGLDHAGAGDGLVLVGPALDDAPLVDERATSGRGESGVEGGALRDADAARDRAEVDALFDGIPPEGGPDRTSPAPEDAAVRKGGTPEGGALAPSGNARAHEKTTPERIREEMVACGLADLCGDGFERKVWNLGLRRHLPTDKLLTIVQIVGQKRRDAVFDANGKPTKFTGEVSLVRGYVYRCIENQPRPEDVPLPREPARRIPRLGRRFADGVPLHDDHGGGMSSQPSSEAARLVLEALLAEYHGEKPLAALATSALATQLAQRSEDAAAGGTLTTADVVETVRAFATSIAFKLKRNGDVPLPGALVAFLRREVRVAARGCADQLKKRTDAAKFYPARQKLDTRQPGTTLDHLRAAPTAITDVERGELDKIFK